MNFTGRTVSQRNKHDSPTHWAPIRLKTYQPDHTLPNRLPRRRHPTNITNTYLPNLFHLTSLTPRTCTVHAGQAGVKLGKTVPRRLSNWRGTVGAVVVRSRSPIVRPFLFKLTYSTNVGAIRRPPPDSKGKRLRGLVGVGPERQSGIWGEPEGIAS